MCGIVGLHLKTDRYTERLGDLLVPMLDCMSTRGPDSAGIGIYSDGIEEGRWRWSLRFSDRTGDLTEQAEALAEELSTDLGETVEVDLLRPDGCVLVTPADETRVRDALRRSRANVMEMAFGRHLELIKDAGRPKDICDRFEVESRTGYQALGHTRMATESAISPDGAHPFAPNADLALVHNGSFSNHATVRRRLAQQGIHCVTANDSEVAARLIARQLDHGATLAESLEQVGEEMDGFYTLLVTSGTEFAVIRDSFACKPLVVAETEDYVAVTSEYIAMADLPGIDAAKVVEPMPGEIYSWTRAGAAA